MNGSFILDSNIVINFFRGDTTTIQRIKNIEKIFIPTIVLGELYYGANKSLKTEKHIAQIEKLIQYVSILPIDKFTALFYGTIKNHLKQIGKPIPENDIWIAAITQQAGFPLMTTDKHFDHIPDIKIVKV